MLFKIEVIFATTIIRLEQMSYDDAMHITSVDINIVMISHLATEVKTNSRTSKLQSNYTILYRVK